jgi:hypothetical protein
MEKDNNYDPVSMEFLNDHLGVYIYKKRCQTCRHTTTLDKCTIIFNPLTGNFVARCPKCLKIIWEKNIRRIFANG